MKFQMIYLVVLFFLIAIFYFLKEKINLILFRQSPSNYQGYVKIRSHGCTRTNKQIGGESENYMKVVIDDRKNLFQFSTDKFEYLDKIDKKIKESSNQIQKRNDEISNFIKQYEKDRELLKKVNIDQRHIQPLYTQQDIDSNKDKIKRLNDFYHKHVQYFITLQDLNNQLIIIDRHCLDKKCLSLTKNRDSILERYNTLKTTFNQQIAEAFDYDTK